MERASTSLNGRFSFGVFGDGPYYPEEIPRFKQVLDDMRSSDIAWLLHIGDLLWNPCTDEALEKRFSELRSAGRSVIYTPGDNEWTDTHDERVGGHDPLERLASIRRILFCNQSLNVNGKAVDVTCQSSHSDYSEFCENSRWAYGGFVFATVHVVGSDNGRAGFSARTSAHDAEVERRTEAAIHWIDQAFDVARQSDARGLVLSMHANIGLERDGSRGNSYERIVDALDENLEKYSRPVTLIHGDTHTHRVDRPFRAKSGKVYDNLTRLEAFGSPEIGWVRVVVDPDKGGIVEIEPRLME
jgi:hypothetical protein